MDENLSGNEFSNVWKIGNWVYKDQHEHFACNELWCFRQMGSSGYVPLVERVSATENRTEYIERESVTDPEEFMLHLPKVLAALKKCGIRHGDLTEYAVLVKNNSPLLIDFSESRLMCDPRSNKREEPDSWWLERTMRKLSGD